MKNEEENEEKQERKKMKCQIGIVSKAHNIIYNPAKFQNESPNIFGDNDLFVPTNSTLLFLEKEDQIR